MAFYGDTSVAAELAGGDIVASDITSAMQTVINDFIDAEINKDGFESTIGQVDYCDINKSHQSWLILKHMPVLAITEVVDDQRNTNPTTIPVDSYVYDEPSAILDLSSIYSTDPLNAKDYFTKGKQSVKVTYNFGYTTVPLIIQSLANMIAAKWADSNANIASSDGLSSVQIGDYKEVFDTMFKSVGHKYDSQISGLFKRAKAIYQRGV
jgi:hypothetical protein